MSGASSKINSCTEKKSTTKTSANHILFTDKIKINSCINTSSIAIGNSAGSTKQGSFSVAIGYKAGQQKQGNNLVAIGYKAGQQNQGNNSVAIGNSAGYFHQEKNSVAIGNGAGLIQQGNFSVAIGNEAGTNNQHNNAVAVAIGNYAGHYNQGNYSVAIGNYAGHYNQGTNSVAIGNSAGNLNQQSYSVAIGYSAGRNKQGANSVAIGYKAGQKEQHSESIILSSSKINAIQNATRSGFYVRPINSIMVDKSTNNLSNLYYNNKSGEISTINNGFFVNNIETKFLGPNSYPLAKILGKDKEEIEKKIFYDITKLKTTVLSEIQDPNNALLYEMYVDGDKEIRFNYNRNKSPLKIECE